MKNRPVMLWKIPQAAEALKLSPRRAIGMAVGAQVPQPQPATIPTARMGTKVPRGIHRAGTSVGRGHGVGSYERGRIGMCCFLLTPGTMGLVRQACKRCGVGGALAARC